MGAVTSSDKPCWRRLLFLQLCWLSRNSRVAAAMRLRFAPSLATPVPPCPSPCAVDHTDTHSLCCALPPGLLLCPSLPFLSHHPSSKDPMAPGHKFGFWGASGPFLDPTSQALRFASTLTGEELREAGLDAAALGLGGAGEGLEAQQPEALDLESSLLAADLNVSALTTQSCDPLNATARWECMAAVGGAAVRACSRLWCCC
jgi:hypothetical protein